MSIDDKQCFRRSEPIFNVVQRLSITLDLSPAYRPTRPPKSAKRGGTPVVSLKDRAHLVAHVIDQRVRAPRRALHWTPTPTLGGLG